jgi:hypothetical protein
MKNSRDAGQSRVLWQRRQSIVTTSVMLLFVQVKHKDPFFLGFSSWQHLMP